MPPTAETTPDSEGPPVKRLPSERLPAPGIPPVKILSPRGTLDSVGDSASPSFRKQNQRQVLSFRDKLFRQVGHSAPVSLSERVKHRNNRPKTSITPIFKRKITAGFQDAATRYHSSPYCRQPQPREPTPDTDPEDLLQQLKSMQCFPTFRGWADELQAIIWTRRSRSTSV